MTELSSYQLFRYAEESGDSSAFEPVLDSDSGDVLAWLEDDQASVVADTTGGFGGWVLRARIPLEAAAAGASFADGLPVGTDELRFWSEWGPAVTDGIVSHKIPLSVDEAGEESGIPPRLPVPPVSEWMPAQVGSSGAECETGGIRLARDDVGVAPDGDAAAALGHQIELEEDNVFVARPENAGASTAPSGSIEATFRIANWGSTIDTGEWQEIGSATLGADLADGDKQPLSMTRSFPADFLDDKWHHQCMLVELRGTGAGPVGDPGITFLNESVYRNMDFVSTNSVFSREAMISARGLPAVPGAAERDMYLYVETRNMPAKADPEEWGRQKKLIDHHLRRIRGGGDARERDEQVDPYEALAELMPTYVVHVYHDTGRRVQRGGEERRVLASQPSFGYYVDHDDELAGWAVALDGAEALGDNWYRISVGDGEAHVVRTRIQGRTSTDEEPIRSDDSWKPEPEQGEEPGADAGPGPKPKPDPEAGMPLWWLLILALAVAALFVILRLRRGSS